MTADSFRATIVAAILLAAGTAGGHAQQQNQQNNAADANGVKATETVEPSDKSKVKAPPAEGGLNAGGTTGEANDPSDPPSVREDYSAPNGGMSSGAHTGNESPTKEGDSSGGKKESERAKEQPQ